MQEVVGENDTTELIAIHKELVENVVFWKLGDPQQAANVSDDILFEFSQNPDCFTSSGLEFRPWILKRTLASLADRSVMTLDFNLALQDPLALALKQMEPVEQDVLILRIIERIPDEEVAQVLGKELQETKDLTFNAMCRIRNMTL